jgi:hypothetical protein
MPSIFQEALVSDVKLHAAAPQAAGEKMIVFDLACDNNHPFEGWFGSAEDFDLQAKAGDIACPVCGSADITRQLSAPYVNTRSGGKQADESHLVSVANAARELKKKFVEHVLSNTEDVGTRFPEEARRIFYKEAPERAIRGTASNQEVGELKEEGIDVMAIPGTPALPEKLH